MTGSKKSKGFIQFLAAMSLVGPLLFITNSGQAHAASGPRVIDVTAHRFSFTPDQITIKKGETVKLRLTSQDVTHGFFSRPLKLDEDLEPGETRELTLTPQEAGTFSIICDHFCGANHGNMNMTIVVE